MLFLRLNFTEEQNASSTRMHSSRMRTGRLLAVGGCFLPSMHCFFPRGCFLPSMHCFLPRGASFPACTASFPGGLPSQHALLLSQGGVSFPACTKTDLPVNRMTDTSKKITLATTSLRSVKKRRILEGYVALVPYYI